MILGGPVEDLVLCADIVKGESVRMFARRDCETDFGCRPKGKVGNGIMDN